MFAAFLKLGLTSFGGYRLGATQERVLRVPEYPRELRIVAGGAPLIDVRSPEEYAAKHLDGAKNIPVDEIDTRLAEIPKDKPADFRIACASSWRTCSTI